MKTLGIIKPKIAVLSINPHVGDNGLIGTEDQKLLIPAINELNKNEDIIFGPFSADTFFCNNYVKYDATLAVYHDQGLIPFKTISFGEGVNYSAGLLLFGLLQIMEQVLTLQERILQIHLLLDML